jgi:hypothetical protein
MSSGTTLGQAAESDRASGRPEGGPVLARPSGRLFQFATRHCPLPSWQAVPKVPPWVRYSRQVCPAAFLNGARSV